MSSAATLQYLVSSRETKPQLRIADKHELERDVLQTLVLTTDKVLSRGFGRVHKQFSQGRCQALAATDVDSVRELKCKLRTIVDADPEWRHDHRVHAVCIQSLQKRHVVPRAA